MTRQVLYDFNLQKKTLSFLTMQQFEDLLDQSVINPNRLKSEVLQLENYIFRDTKYCGRLLGKDAIPGSDGQCGPNNGPQCADCKSGRFSDKNLKKLKSRLLYDPNNDHPTNDLDEILMHYPNPSDMYPDPTYKFVIRARRELIQQAFSLHLNLAKKKQKDPITTLNKFPVLQSLTKLSDARYQNLNEE